MCNYVIRCGHGYVIRCGHGYSEVFRTGGPRKNDQEKALGASIKQAGYRGVVTIGLTVSGIFKG